MERDCGQRCAWGAVLAVGAFGCCGACMASLLGVFGGDVDRARMACGRCECGRRNARCVIQNVGVMQHSSFRGTLGRQELVGKVVVWGREAGGGGSVVCVGPVASRPTIYVFGVTLKAWAFGAGLGLAFEGVRLTGRLAARLCCVCPSRTCVCRAFICTARLGS